jgi:hypothetical protein
MFALHKRVNPKEVIVGWYPSLCLIDRIELEWLQRLTALCCRYLTSANLSGATASVHEEFRKFMSAAAPSASAAAEPVLLTVDTQLTGNKMGVKSYTAKSFVVGERVVMSRFELAPLEFHATTQEKIGGACVSLATGLSFLTCFVVLCCPHPFPLLSSFPLVCITLPARSRRSDFGSTG